MTQVTFKAIGIQNLGPYRDRQTIDLEVQAQRPIVLIRALNGSGKTTLLNCLQIALYGGKAIGSGKQSEYEHLIRGLYRDDGQSPPLVALDLDIGVNGFHDRITIQRHWNLGPKMQEYVQVLRNGAPDERLTIEWGEYLDGILPAELLQLFLFDGEKIEALANPKTLPERLRRATEAFLGIGGIDALYKDLAAVERRAVLNNKEANDEYELARTELKQIERQQSAVEAGLHVMRQTLPTVEAEARQAQEAYEAVSAHAQRSGLSAYEKAAEIRAAEQSARDAVHSAATQVREALADPLSALALAGTLWDDYEAEWTAQQDVRTNQQLLTEIQRRDRRVLESLGRILPVPMVESVSLALEDDSRRYAEVADRPIFLVTATDPHGLRLAIRQAHQRHVKAREQLEDAKQKLAEMERQLAGIPAGEQLSDVLNELKRLAQVQAQAQERLAFVQKQIQDQQSLLDHVSVRVNSARTRMSKDFQGNAHTRKALGAAIRSRAVLMTFKERLLAAKAKWLSEKITEEFQALMRKQRLVNAVRVHPETYEVTIVGGNDRELPMERLSAGERQLLAIAVLSALIRERKGQFPVVVDTPLARLDRTHREALIRRFFAKVSHQVMVLSTDEEVEGSVFDAMAPYTSKAYQIDFSDDTRSSHVGPLLEMETA